MTVTISIPDEVGAKLNDRAAAHGKEPPGYASELLARALALPDERGLPPDQISYEQWKARSDAFQAMMAEFTKDLPPGHFVDDSREAIYAGRGE